MDGDGDLEICHKEEQAKQVSTLYFDTLISGINEKKNNASTKVFILLVPCKQPCCTMEVDLVNRYSEPTMDGNTKLQITFPPTVKYYKELYIYEVLSMVAGEYCQSN